MNLHNIHTAIHSQTSDGGPDTPIPISPEENDVMLSVCVLDLALSPTAWHTLAFSLIRLLKRIQGRTVTGVSYTAIPDRDRNPDGSIGTITIKLEPLS